MAHSSPIDDAGSPLEARTARPAARTVRVATASDAPGVESALVRAFDADPVVNWLVRSDGRRGDGFLRFFRLIFRWTLPLGHAYTTTDVAGAALWRPPGRWKAGPLEQLGFLPGLIRAFGPRNAFRRLGATNALDEKHPHALHFYLVVAGVDPDLQNQGIGGLLLRPVLERCDRDGMAAYLEASSERNVPFYERNGFRVEKEFRMASDAPPVWLMWREPNAGT